LLNWHCALARTMKTTLIMMMMMMKRTENQSQLRSPARNL